MFTSDIKKTALLYLAASVFCMIVNLIYGRFAHGVSSAYMTYMFLYPLFGGSLLLFLQKHMPPLSVALYGCGIFTLTLGSFIDGIFIIAGTDSPYVVLYYIVGILQLVFSILYLWHGRGKTSR